MFPYRLLSKQGMSSATIHTKDMLAGTTRSSAVMAGEADIKARQVAASRFPRTLLMLRRPVLPVPSDY